MLRRETEEPAPAARRQPATCTGVIPLGDSIALMFRLQDHRGRELELPLVVGKQAHGGTRLVRALRALSIDPPADDAGAKALDLAAAVVGKRVDAELRHDSDRSGGAVEAPTIWAIYRGDEEAS